MVKDTFGTIKLVFCAFIPNTLILELSPACSAQKEKFTTLILSSVLLVQIRIHSLMVNIAHLALLILNGTT
jgi:hypothetical protein